MYTRYARPWQTRPSGADHVPHAGGPASTPSARGDVSARPPPPLVDVQLAARQGLNRRHIPSVPTSDERERSPDDADADPSRGPPAVPDDPGPADAVRASAPVLSAPPPGSAWVVSRGTRSYADAAGRRWSPAGRPGPGARAGPPRRRIPRRCA